VEVSRCRGRSEYSSKRGATSVVEVPPVSWARGLSVRECIAGAALLALALVFSALVEIYDSRSAAVRVALTALSIGMSYSVFWLALAALRVPPVHRTRSAFWSLVPWNIVLLSQLPYIGYMLIPFEMIMSAVAFASLTF
jgi:hypothetical protein